MPGSATGTLRGESLAQLAPSIPTATIALSRHAVAADSTGGGSTIVATANGTAPGYTMNVLERANGHNRRQVGRWAGVVLTLIDPIIATLLSAMPATAMLMHHEGCRGQTPKVPHLPDSIFKWHTPKRQLNNACIQPSTPAPGPHLQCVTMLYQVPYLQLDVPPAHTKAAALFTSHVTQQSRIRHHRVLPYSALQLQLDVAAVQWLPVQRECNCNGYTRNVPGPANGHHTAGEQFGDGTLSGSTLRPSHHLQCRVQLCHASQFLLRTNKNCAKTR